MKLNVEEQTIVVVNAKDIYGGMPTIQVEIGEVYAFEVLPRQHWTDAFIRTTANGFLNPLMLFASKRVKNAKCFTLCGTIGQDEENHFKIGSQLDSYTIPFKGDLYFFPNDSIRHYNNNKGSISLTVRRVK